MALWDPWVVWARGQGRHIRNLPDLAEAVFRCSPAESQPQARVLIAAPHRAYSLEIPAGAALCAARTYPVLAAFYRACSVPLGVAHRWTTHYARGGRAP